MKRITDKLGWTMSVGAPSVRHLRASDPMVNLVKEAPGISYNEKFWELVWDCKLIGDTALGCLEEMSNHLARVGDAYMTKLGLALKVWASLFKE